MLFKEIGKLFSWKKPVRDCGWSVHYGRPCPALRAALPAEHRDKDMLIITRHRLTKHGKRIVLLEYLTQGEILPSLN